MSMTQASASTLTFVGGGSRKFYRIYVAGKVELRQWGAIGATGQTSIKVHSSTSAAVAAAERQLDMKEKKGYGSRDVRIFPIATPLLESTNAKRIIPTTYDAYIAGSNGETATAVYADDLDEILDIPQPAVSSPLNVVADRALAAVTLAASGDATAASIEYAKIREEMDAVTEQYERCQSFLETIEMMLMGTP